MAARPASQPNVRTFSLDDVVAETQSGRVRIPTFQRSLRWQWEDVRRLFDSIVKGYPIGTLLLWKRPAKAGPLTLGALSVEAPECSEAWWVVDGQQRIISLANALDDRGYRDERFGLAYDLRAASFQRPPQQEDPYVIPLPVLFNLQRLLRWFSGHPEVAESLDDASRVTKAIREFSIPAYVVEQQDEAILREIFDRMNNYGRRLSRAEVFSALNPGSEAVLEPRSRFGNIIESLDLQRGFGQLDEDTVLRAVLARRGGDVTREIRLEFADHRRHARDFGDESVEAAYTGAERALSLAIAFLQDDAGVPHFAFLPYRYLLVALARLFAHFPEPSQRNRDLLRRWFWRAALLGPESFSGSWTGAMRTLATRIVAGDESGSVQHLLELPLGPSMPMSKLTGFRTSTADSRIALCALWSLGPRSFANHRAYTRQDLTDAIPPGGTAADAVGRILRKEPAGHRAWAANRIFTLQEQRPAAASLLSCLDVLFEREEIRATLRSHALTEEVLAELARGDEVAFLEGRQRRVEAVVRDFLAGMTELQLEDTPPLDSLDLDEEDEERDDARDEVSDEGRHDERA